MQSKTVPLGLKAIHGVCTLALLAASVLAAGQETALHSFRPNGADAAFPAATLIADGAGDLYGTSPLGGTLNQGVVFELLPQQGGGWTEKVLHSFGSGTDGKAPYGSLVLDSAGNLYGTTSGGGPYAAGMVFELLPQSNGTWTETVLHNFRGGSDGSNAEGGLVFDTLGNLYGTTNLGGGHSAGTVFQMSPRQGGGWTETVIHNFGSGTDGAYPAFSGLVIDAMGNLYGTTQQGGMHTFGTAFVVKPRSGGGWTETVLHAFNSDGFDGVSPEVGVILDSHGNVFGTTLKGGTHNRGTFYELAPQQNGTYKETIQHSFQSMLQSGLDGTTPMSTLALDSAGNVYGTTSSGGANGFGTVFEFVPGTITAWTEYILYNFTFNAADGIYPQAGLILGSNGSFYGTTQEGGTKNAGTVFQLTPQQGGGWQESVAYSFNFRGHDGALSTAGLVSDAAGNFYGTTSKGGGNDSGTAFQLSPAQGGGWTETVMHNFGSGMDGAQPAAGMIADAAGNFYGTTAMGGSHNAGTVFEISPQQGGGWTSHTLHHFVANGTDGVSPFGGLVFDSAGNLYGTTAQGGTAGTGTVFQLSPRSGGGWNERTIHSFVRDGKDGITPYAGMIIDANGNLYGTTSQGGLLGRGVVFEISPAAGGTWTETAIYAFLASPDGANPQAGLVLDTAGNLYGTTLSGGSNGDGIVFELTPQQNGTWTETVLFNFDGTHGSSPYGGLTFFGSPASLFGTTSAGGANAAGTVYELTPLQGGGWMETDLYDFNPSAGDGSSPEAGVIFDGSGNLYSTTLTGGTYNSGMVFEVTP
jgi:uncharacterized repeat protein (TIGR03803 family)